LTVKQLLRNANQVMVVTVKQLLRNG
jgi:hypothetical protein